MSRITMSSMLLVIVIALTCVDTAHAGATKAEIDAFKARVQRFEAAKIAYDAEGRSYEHARTYYNSLPAEKRTKFQRDRLARWYTRLEWRRKKLEDERRYLIRLASRL